MFIPPVPTDPIEEHCEFSVDATEKQLLADGTEADVLSLIGLSYTTADTPSGCILPGATVSVSI